MNVGKLDIRVEISKVEQSIDVKNIWYVSKKFKFEQADMYRVPRKEFIFRWERAQGQYARFISYEANILSLCSLPLVYKLFTR